MRFPSMPVLATGRVVTYRSTGACWFQMAPSPGVVPAARQFTRRVLAGCDSGYVDDAEVVTSELVTNSLKYALAAAGPPEHVVPGIWLGVQALKRFCHLYVRDPHPVPPVRRTAGGADTSGRGLFIVEALTAAFWVETRAFDKTVHAVVAKPGVVLTEAELGRLRR